jgi:cytochrome c553
MKRDRRPPWWWLLVGAQTIWMSLSTDAPARAEDADLRAAKEAMTYLHAVAMHPRCMNCHGRVHDGRLVPLVGDGREPHPMNITDRHNPDTRSPRVGLACISCHGRTNSPQPGGPPGARVDWRMPTHEDNRLWPDRGRVELCDQWQKAIRELIAREKKEPPQPFEERVIEHFRDDPLIAWAFDPGPGRTRAPGSPAQLVSMAVTWARWLTVNSGSCQQLDNR